VLADIQAVVQVFPEFVAVLEVFQGFEGAQVNDEQHAHALVGFFFPPPNSTQF
jgi:hypothetical protein